MGSPAIPIGFRFVADNGRTYEVVSRSSGGYVNVTSVPRGRQGRVKVAQLKAQRDREADKARYSANGTCDVCHGPTSSGNCVLFNGGRYCESPNCTQARLRASASTTAATGGPDAR